jgi:hypothetical protein
MMKKEEGEERGKKRNGLRSVQVTLETLKVTEIGVIQEVELKGNHVSLLFQ